MSNAGENFRPGSENSTELYKIHLTDCAAHYDLVQRTKSLTGGQNG